MAFFLFFLSNYFLSSISFDSNRVTLEKRDWAHNLKIVVRDKQISFYESWGICLPFFFLVVIAMVWSKFYSNSSFDEVDETHPHRVQNLCRRLIERWYRSECGTTLSFWTLTILAWLIDTYDLDLILNCNVKTTSVNSCHSSLVWEKTAWPF